MDSLGPLLVVLAGFVLAGVAAGAYDETRARMRRSGRMKKTRRCEGLLAAVDAAGEELDRHLVTDEAGDTYPGDTPEARAAVEASVAAFREWSEECSG